MKTKNKALAVLEIAIVLCSVFLVALPVIATDKTTQEVSAAGVTTASEDDFILEIYGNANEDDCIDMRDYTYTARIICWLEDETDFADANYDGRISVADMTQIGLIILGRESELTFVDSADRIVTVRKPVERIVTISLDSAEAVTMLKAEDRVVGVGTYVKADKVFYPELSKLPGVGDMFGVDCEVVLELNPDIIIGYVGYPPDLEEKLEPAGITVLRLVFYTPESLIENTEKLGYILGQRQEAEEFIDFYEECLNSIKEQTEKLSEEDKPRVYLEAYDDYTSWGSWWTAMIAVTGGIDIYTGEIYGEVDKEWLLEQDPDIIVKDVFYVSGGYGVDDPSGMKAVWESILDRTELATVTAIENEDVFVIHYTVSGTIRHFVGIAYMAKWFHPELFEDLDPKALHQEYLTEFQGLDIDLDEKGVFVYPPWE